MTRNWDPNEWQAYCQELMTVHYGVQVQLVPDRDRGDGGLEAYVSQHAIAFQCYAPEDPFTVKSQTDSQIRKIRIDTQKLIDNAVKTTRLIGQGNVIDEWVLLTPRFESKRLLEYANTRSNDIRGLSGNHSWCGNNFRISVHDDSLFAAAKATLFGTRRTELTIQSDPVDVTQWREEGWVPQGIEKTLQDKFEVDPGLQVSPKKLDRYLEANLRDYFQGAAELDRLSREVPSVHKTIVKCVGTIFASLARYLAEADERPVVVVGSIEDRLTAALTTGVPGLGQDLISLLSRYYIASWWVQCPLEFDAVLED